MNMQEFTLGVWHPIETAPIDTWVLFGNVNWEAHGRRKYVLGQISAEGKADCLRDKGGFTAWMPIPPLGEVKTPEPIPLIRDFIFSKLLKKGDELITSKGGVYKFVTYDVESFGGRSFYAHNKNGTPISWGDCGWHLPNGSGNRAYEHIIEVWRKGDLVAKGQNYAKTI